jgi:hypothetical protein
VLTCVTVSKLASLTMHLDDNVRGYLVPGRATHKE